MNTAVLISLCIIAKNEENCLARCLRSAQKVADEIIVVDTGSTDDTVKIALENGANVHFFTWIDDFAAARNYAISKAKGNWILVLDADEALYSVTREELFSFMEHFPAEGYYFRICSHLDNSLDMVEDYVVRLFRNVPDYRFAGAIHEQIAGSILRSHSGGGLAFAPFTIEHYGYQTTEVEAKCKFDRNTSIIRKALGKCPQDPFLYYSLGIEYLQKRDYRQAGETLEKALPLLHGDEGYIEHLVVALLLVTLTQEQSGSPELFRRALLILPENGDIYSLYGVWLMQRQQFCEAAAILEKAMTKQRNMIDRGQLNALLGDAYFLAGLCDKATECYASALGEGSVASYALERMLILWQSSSRPAVERVLWRVFTPATAQNLLQRSQEKYQLDLALAINLLSIAERAHAGDIASLAELCSMYHQMLKSALPVNALSGSAYDILAVGGEELLLQSQLLQMSGGHIKSILNELQKLVLGQLPLIIAPRIQEFSGGDPLRFWQEVFLG